MDLGFAGRQLTSVEIDYTVLLTFAEDYEIQTGREILLYDDAGTWHVDPEDLSPEAETRLRALTGTVVLASTAEDSGRLRVDFVNGTAIRVEPDETYEAWTFAGPDGAKVISEPGGGLAVWSALS